MLAKNHTKTSRTEKKNMVHYSIKRRALFKRMDCNSRYRGEFMMMNWFHGMFDWRKSTKPYFQPGSMSKVPTIANLPPSKGRIYMYAETKVLPLFCVVVIATSTRPRCNFNLNWLLLSIEGDNWWRQYFGDVANL